MTRHWAFVVLAASLAACGSGSGSSSGSQGSGGAPPPTCTDGVKNGSETAVDCGGPTCPKCASGLACVVSGDCASGVCAGNVCQVPTCTDGVKNGGETAVDCGGPTCPKCANGLACVTPSDCVSAICTAGTCQATCPTYPPVIPSASCGGSRPPCAAGLACSVPADCASGVCTGGACQEPRCGDGVKNGGETDVDCGGGCASCSAGKSCSTASDCRYAVCTANVCQPGSGGTINVGNVILGNLVPGTVTIQSGPGDPCPATLVYTYFGLQQSADVYSQLRAAVAAGNVAPALDEYLELNAGRLPTNLALLTANLAAPPAFLFYTWAGQSRFQLATTVNGYDGAATAKAVLGITTATVTSNNLNPAGATSFTLAGQQYVGTGIVNRYDAVATITATVSFVPAAQPSGATATAQGGGIGLAWTNPGSASFAHVAIYRSTTPGYLGSRIATTGSASVATYQDAAVTRGTTYYYTLHSVDTQGGESPNADQVWATAP